MGGRAGARRAERHLSLILLGIFDEVLQRVGGKILARDEDQRHLGDEGRGREIAGGVVGRLLVERLVLGVGADGAEHEGGAVGRRPRDALRAGHAAGAADILDHHLLAEDLAHALGHDAPEHVGGTARREGDDHGHGPRRPVLLRARRAREHQNGA